MVKKLANRRFINIIGDIVILILLFGLLIVLDDSFRTYRYTETSIFYFFTNFLIIIAIFFSLSILFMRKIKRGEINKKKLFMICLIILFVFFLIFLSSYYPIIPCEVHYSNSDGSYDKWVNEKYPFLDIFFYDVPPFSCKKEVYVNLD